MADQGWTDAERTIPREIGPERISVTGDALTSVRWEDWQELMTNAATSPQAFSQATAAVVQWAEGHAAE